MKPNRLVPVLVVARLRLAVDDAKLHVLARPARLASPCPRAGHEVSYGPDVPRGHLQPRHVQQVVISRPLAAPEPAVSFWGECMIVQMTKTRKESFLAFSQRWCAAPFSAAFVASRSTLSKRL